MTTTIATTRPRRGRALLALAAAGALVLGACTNTENEAEGGDIPTEDVTSHIEADAEIAESVPAEIAERGALVVGTNPPYAPNEFKDPSGEIVGFDIDFITGVAKIMDLDVQLQESDFARIIPGIQGGTMDVGVSSMTDTFEREESVDFVTYFSAGTQWAQQVDSDVEVDPEMPCGLTVAVQRNTVQDTEELETKNQACLDAGEPAINKEQFDEQDLAANALALGRVDAFLADSPVTLYAVNQNEDTIETVGPVFEAAPYGIAVAQDSELTAVLLEAVEKLIESGEYQKIAEKWGLEDGIIDEPVINGAVY